MDLMELGAVGELVGGVAVIASLIFVGIQIRSNTRTLRATSTYEAVHAWVEINDQLASNPELGTAVYRWLYGSGDLDDRATMLVNYWRRGFLQRTEAQYVLFKAGLMERELWENRRDLGRRLLLNGPAHVQAWWRNEGPESEHMAEFIAELDPEKGR